MGLLGEERSRANWLGSVSLCKKEYHMKMAYPGEARLRLVTVLQAAVAEPGPSIRAPASAAEQARELLGDKDREQFMVFHLDGKHRLVSAETISVGTLTTSLVHPREVFKGALLANAAAIICAHNHPSGDVDPSVEDRQVYERLRESADLLGIPLLDFLVVSPTASWSAREHWM